MVPLGQQQIGLQRASVGDEDLVEGGFSQPRSPLLEDAGEASTQRLGRLGIGLAQIVDLVEVAAEKDAQFLWAQAMLSLEVTADGVGAVGATAEALVVVGGIEALQPQIDPLGDHGLEGC